MRIVIYNAYDVTRYERRDFLSKSGIAIHTKFSVTIDVHVI